MTAEINEGAPSRSDWEIARDNLQRQPSRWGSLSWISAKALIDSVNHSLNRFSDGLVPQLRSAWVARTPAPPLRLLERPYVTTFMIVGDSGEQDASQYVVCPSLSAAVREHRPGFVLVASDVVYPAGAADDYADAVYRPYRSPDPHFCVDAPLLGLPGNHDWYDGLAGFMFHFAAADRLPPEAYAPRGVSPRAIVGRLSRIIWRRPSAPGAASRALREPDDPSWASALTRDIVQPGPYYAIRTRHLLLVAIDTGIDGYLDREQWEWLKTVSAEPGPKVLITGRPLLVNAKLDPCWVDGRPKDGRGDSVWELVNQPSHGYVATIGGDIHNYQKYVPDGAEAGGPQLHLVCGGGGAFLHPTHTYAIAKRDSRSRNNPTSAYHALPAESFPTRNDSVRHFAGLLVPGVLRIMGRLGLFLAGVLVGGIAALLPAGLGPWYATSAGALAVFLLLVLVGLRSINRDLTRTTALARHVVSVGAVALGALAATSGYRLDPVNFRRYLLVWLGFTALHCVVGAAIRRSGWWRPADEFNRNLNPVAFAVGVLVLAGVVFAVLLALNPVRDWRWPLGGALLIIVVAAIGWVLRRQRFPVAGEPELDERTKDLRGRRNRRWHLLGSFLVPAVQAVIFAIGLRQLSRLVDRPWLFTGALAGVGLVLGILLAVATALLLLTELPARLAMLGAAEPGRRYAYVWGRAAAVAHHLGLPMLLAATGLVVARADTLTGRAATGLPLAVFSVVAYLVGVVWLRPRIGRAYLPIAIAVPVLLLGAAYLASPWWARAALGAAIVLLALGVSLVLGHLAFLGAQLLLLTPGALQNPTFTDEQLDAIYAARGNKPPSVADVPRPALLWFRLTAPGLGEPGGLLQQKVAEIFASNRPPFSKSFLRIDTTAEELQLTLHRVTGTAPADTRLVGRLPLARQC